MTRFHFSLPADAKDGFAFVELALGVAGRLRPATLGLTRVEG